LFCYEGTLLLLKQDNHVFSLLSFFLPHGKKDQRKETDLKSHNKDPFVSLLVEKLEKKKRLCVWFFLVKEKRKLRFSDTSKI